jgi:SAM-dependent methyltransferase
VESSARIATRRADSALLHGQREWDELASLDPLWAVLTAPEWRDGWSRLDEFFATGEREIDDVLERSAALERPARREQALDFGCGVGRLTRALGARFNACVGVDISGRMVETASRLNMDRPSCRFVVNAAPDLEQFESRSFDFVYSALALQHVPSAATAARYVREFLRIVRSDGLVVFQVPHRIPWPYRFHGRRHAYRLLRRLGVNERVLYERIRLTPMRMLYLAEPAVQRLVEAAGGVLAQVERDDPGPLAVASRRYFVHVKTTGTA